MLRQLYPEIFIQFTATGETSTVQTNETRIETFETLQIIKLFAATGYVGQFFATSRFFGMCIKVTKTLTTISVTNLTRPSVQS